MEGKVKILFDDSSREWVLSNVFNKSIDKDGFITENNGNKVSTPEGKELTASELAVIKKGSEKFIAGDLTSLIKLAEGEL